MKSDGPVYGFASVEDWSEHAYRRVQRTQHLKVLIDAVQMELQDSTQRHHELMDEINLLKERLRPHEHTTVIAYL